MAIYTGRKNLPALVVARPGEDGRDDRAGGYIAFSDARELVWRKKKTLLGCAGIGLVLAILLATAQKSVYQAKTTIEVQMPNEDYLNRRQLNPVVEPGIILLEPFVQTQLKLIQTDTILLRVIEQLGGRLNPEFNPSPGRLATLYQQVLGHKSRPHTNATILEHTRKRLTVRTAGQTQIVELLFESPNPECAARFLNTQIGRAHV